MQVSKTRSTASFAQWLPDSGYALRDAPLHYLYLDDPETVAEGELRADIRVPVQTHAEADEDF